MSIEYDLGHELALGTVSAVDVTIANGASLSDACNLFGWDLVGIQTPTAWTAAAITFEVATDRTAGASTFPLFVWNYGELSIALADVPTAARKLIALNPGDFQLAEQVKVRSGLSTATVNQGASRTITLLRRRLGGSSGD